MSAQEQEGAGGNCFPNAVHLAEQLGHQALVCHGKPIGQGPLNGRARYWHAWIEADGADGWMVIDASAVDKGEPVRIVPRSLYYEAGQIVAGDVLRFTRLEALRAMNEYGHYGPWTDDWEGEL